MIEKSTMSNVHLKDSEWEKLLVKTGEKTKTAALMKAINAYLDAN